MLNTQGNTCEDLSMPLWSTPPPKSPLPDSARLSWGNFDLFPCIKFSVVKQRGEPVQLRGLRWFIAFLLVRLCLSCQANWVDSCFRPHRVPEQVRLGSGAAHACAHAGVHTHTHTYALTFSVTVQNPDLVTWKQVWISSFIFQRVSFPEPEVYCQPALVHWLL